MPLSPSVEPRIREHCEHGALRDAATLVLKEYGGEIYGFLASRLREEVNAAEVYSMFAEDLWRGLPHFEWRSTIRTYCYTIAHHALLRFLRDPGRRPVFNVSLNDTDGEEFVAQARTQTQTFLRTERRSQLQMLRDRLSPDDQTLLVLRVDRKLPWADLVSILREANDTVPSDEVKEAARLRRRFQTIKATLQQLARAEGLIS